MKPLAVCWPADSRRLRNGESVRCDHCRVPYTLKLSPYRADYKLPANAIGVRPFVPYGHAVSLFSSDLSSFSFIFLFSSRLRLEKVMIHAWYFFLPNLSGKLVIFFPRLMMFNVYLHVPKNCRSNRGIFIYFYFSSFDILSLRKFSQSNIYLRLKEYG